MYDIMLVLIILVMLWASFSTSDEIESNDTTTQEVSDVSSTDEDLTDEVSKPEEGSIDDYDYDPDNNEENPTKESNSKRAKSYEEEEDDYIYDASDELDVSTIVRQGGAASDFWHEDAKNGTQHCHCGCRVQLSVSDRWQIIKWALVLDVSVAIAYFIGMVICVKYYGLEQPSERFIFSAEE